jgi:uncharacterized phosphatase
MKQLYFVRHGQTHANAANIWSGTLETPLNETGRAQAKSAGEQAMSLNIDYIICSTLGRAIETAEIIAKEIGFPVEQIEHNSLFIERHFGKMEGTPRDFEADLDIDGFVDIEAHDTILERANLALQYVKTIDADNILIVSHGSFGRAFRSLTHPHVPFEPLSTDETRLKNAEILKLI